MMELNLAGFLGPLGAAGNGAPPSIGLLYWFYVEGLAFAVAMIYLYHVLRGSWQFYNPLAKWIDRAIIDDFYHKYLPRAVESSYRRLFNKFETPVMDEGYNKKLVDAVLGLGGMIKRVQTGRINHYLIAFVLGLVFFIVVVFGMVLL